MKKIFFTAGIAVMLLSCNADEELTQDAAQDNSATVADFKTPEEELIKEGTYVDLINVSKNAASFEWDLGDGTISTEAAPHHLYDKCGTYNVKLTVTDFSGEQSTVEKSVDVFCTVPMHRANPMIYGRN